MDKLTREQTWFERLFREEPKNLLEEVVLIRKRLGWAIFWLILIALGIGTMIDLLEKLG